MQRVGDVIDGGAPAGEFLLYGHADALDKILVAVLLLQLFLKLRRKHRQKFGIAGNERALGVGGAKYDGVARGSANDGTTKMTLNGLDVRARLHELHAQRRQARTRAEASDREHPGEAAIDQHRRLDLLRQKPAELDAPLFVVLFLQDLFRAGELLVASHLVDGCAEVLG